MTGAAITSQLSLCEGISSRASLSTTRSAEFRRSCIPGGTTQPSSRGRRGLRVRAVGWDPEGILAPPQPHHIARRSYQKQLSQDEAAAQMEEQEKLREKERKRQARMMREVPEEDAALLEYLLKIGKEEGEEELEFEVARCGPRLTDSFFATVRSAMGSIRFAVRQSEEDTERLAALGKLETQLLAQVEKQENLRNSLMGAKERLHALLSAPDKKEMILAMAANGELDRSLLNLLDENIVAAQGAGQDEAVKFMEKIRGAVIKYTPTEQLVQS